MIVSLLSLIIHCKTTTTTTTTTTIFDELVDTFRRYPRHSAAKTVLRPSRYLGRPSSGEVQLEHAVGLASFLSASSPHSTDWLFAVPISSCGLRLNDKAVRIGVCLRLGLTVCVPHQCHCGASVEPLGLHGFGCKKAPGRPARHHA